MSQIHSSLSCVSLPTLHCSQPLFYFVPQTSWLSHSYPAIKIPRPATGDYEVLQQRRVARPPGAVRSHFWRAIPCHTLHYPAHKIPQASSGDYVALDELVHLVASDLLSSVFLSVVLSQIHTCTLYYPANKIPRPATALRTVVV